MLISVSTAVLVQVFAPARQSQQSNEKYSANKTDNPSGLSVLFFYCKLLLSFALFCIMLGFEIHILILSRVSIRLFVHLHRLSAHRA